MTGSSDPSPAGTLTDPIPAAGPERALAVLLERPRYEVLPFPGTADECREHLPPTLPVTVTASPRRGLEPTIVLTEELARSGYAAVPHLAARMLRDEGQVGETLARLDEAGVRDVFVVAGDGAVPVGDFSDSLQVLRAVERLRAAGGAPRLQSVGVAGYPEEHPLVAADALERALLAKQPLSGYVVTQMCFEAGAVLGWIDHVRRLGVSLPVHIGVAGAVDRLKLVRVASRIGVGTSLRFLRRHRGGTGLLSSGYRPDRLLERLASDAPPGAVAGLHVYTLGDVATTERWRRRLLDRLSEGDVHA